jgi:Domain of unknown function (DUF4328)
MSSGLRTLLASPSVRPLGRLVIGLLGLDILLGWVVLAGIATYVARVWLGLAGQVLGSGTLAQHAGQFEAARVLQGLAWLATAGAFLAWVHRAYRNLALFGVPDLGYSPRWAVGAFLVPMLNLIHPLRVVRELWNASDPAGSGEAHSRQGATPRWLLAWWSIFLASVAADPVVVRLVGGAERGLDLGGGARWVVAGALLEMTAAVLAIAVVSRITRGQEARLERQDRRAGSLR